MAILSAEVVGEGTAVRIGNKYFVGLGPKTIADCWGSINDALLFKSEQDAMNNLQTIYYSDTLEHCVCEHVVREVMTLQRTRRVLHRRD